jgi:hypothetical protein
LPPANAKIQIKPIRAKRRGIEYRLDAVVSKAKNHDHRLFVAGLGQTR